MTSKTPSTTTSFDHGTSTDANPHEGDGNQGSGRYGQNPYGEAETTSVVATSTPVSLKGSAS